ncbi:MAG: carboxypeptidase-like regulatory domain-containing protein [Leptospiraceae bacterium]
MARSLFLPLTIFLVASCAGLQQVEQPTAANLSFPEVQYYPLPDRPVASLAELEQEPVTLAYSIDFESLDSPELRRIVEQRIHGWLRNIQIRGAVLPTFRISANDSPPQGYPYTLRIQIKSEAENEYSLNAKMEHNPSGRSYAVFKRNFGLDPGGDHEGLALFSGLSAFLSDGTGPSMSFPASSGDELRDWVSLLGTGQVKVISGQEASVQIRNRNGQSVHSGQTPVVLDLPAGAYEFTIKRKGMQPRIRTLIVRPAAQDVLLMSWPDDESASSLSVFTSPPRLQVALEGTVQGAAPLAFPSLMSGEIQVEIARKEEDSGEAFVMRKSTVSMGEGEDITRYYPFDYYIDFQRAPEAGNLWASNQALKAVRKDSDQLKLETVRNQDGLPPGLLSHPLEAMDQRIRISFLPGKDWNFGLSSGKGSDRPYLSLQGSKLLFNAPGSGSTAEYVRPVPSEGQLEVLEIRYEAEDSELTILLNGAEVYDGPYQNSGYFSLYLSGPANLLPIQEMEVHAGPILGNAVVRWGRGMIFSLGRSLGLYSRLRPVPEETSAGEGK